MKSSAFPCFPLGNEGKAGTYSLFLFIGILLELQKNFLGLCKIVKEKEKRYAERAKTFFCSRDQANDFSAFFRW